MLFYEITRPYKAVVKAPTKEEAVKEYLRAVSSVDEEAEVIQEGTFELSKQRLYEELAASTLTPEEAKRALHEPVTELVFVMYTLK